MSICWRMNMKNTILRPAAAVSLLFLAASAADAAAPIPEPETPQFVRACDAYGPGYFYIPGTDTCLRISGFVRSEVQGGDQVYARRYEDRHRKTYSWLARGTLKFSTASETDLGALRTYMELRSDWKSGAEFGSANDDTGGSLRFAYIDLGGLRVGLDETIFAHWTGYYGKVINDDILNPASTRTNVISYTYQGQNGFSAILGAEQGNNFDGDGNPQYIQSEKDGTWSAGSNKGGYRFHDNGPRFRKLSQQTHNYAPYIVAGLKYQKNWATLSTVFGYDTYDSEWAAKLRADVNLTDKLSVFLMGGYKSMDDYYNIDTTYGDNGKRIVNKDGKQITRYGIYRQVNSLYGDWGGHWAAWSGATYKIRPKTDFNMQLAYSDDRTFATAANISHELVPGLNITPEIAYINWDNRYGRKYADGNEFRTSLKGKSALQGVLRLQRSF